VLDGRRATCYPGFEDQLGGASPSQERVVTDEHVVTSRGPGTAFEFSLALVARLVDDETAEALRDGMLLTT
jgi:4-methyl-5(b-hydroxyethyl)-thiazole monophosphate biosynthesis